MSHSPQKLVLGYVFIFYSLICLSLAFVLSHQQPILLPPPSARTEVKPAPPPLPTVTKTDTLKHRFYARLLPAIQQQNDRVLNQRQQLREIKQQLADNAVLNEQQLSTLNRWKEEYRTPDELEGLALVDDLLVRIDMVPASMVLAQGAMESAWGRSRFAKEANNYFGQWCFSQGCGIVPSRRAEGATHEVARFASIEAAVAAYLRNINSHPAYAQVRQIRANSRAENRPLDSLAMAQGLEQYSAKGHQYILDLQGMIRYNKLKQYDRREPNPQDMAQQEDPFNRG